jgi:peptidoglycan hydrolase CwlO-like protein
MVSVTKGKAVNLMKTPPRTWLGFALLIFLGACSGSNNEADKLSKQIDQLQKQIDALRMETTDLKRDHSSLSKDVNEYRQDYEWLREQVYELRGAKRR